MQRISPQTPPPSDIIARSAYGMGHATLPTRSFVERMFVDVSRVNYDAMN
jgi:hypothetical protein